MWELLEAIFKLLGAVGMLGFSILALVAAAAVLALGFIYVLAFVLIIGFLWAIATLVV